MLWNIIHNIKIASFQENTANKNSMVIKTKQNVSILSITISTYQIYIKKI